MMVPLNSLNDAWLIGMAAVALLGAGSFIGLLHLRRSRRQSVAWKRTTAFGLSIWMAGAMMVLIELGVALFCDRTDSFSKTKISRRWYELHVRTNVQGYRDEHPLDRPLKPGQKRIVFVGDSFTFGHGVEVAERFSDRIAARLEQDAPGRFRVANAALPGLDCRGLVDQIVPEILQPSVRPDILVYTFVPNDIEFFDERTADFYRTLSNDDPTCPLLRESYFLNLMYYRVRQLGRATAPDYYGYLKDSYTGPPWERMEAKLRELVSICRAKGVDLRIVVFPFLQSVGDANDPFAPAYEKMVAFCNEAGIPVLDLRSPLNDLRERGGALAVNRFDAHPGPQAHKTAADAIEESLLDDLIQPSTP